MMNDPRHRSPPTPPIRGSVLSSLLGPNESEVHSGEAWEQSFAPTGPLGHEIRLRGFSGYSPSGAVSTGYEWETLSRIHVRLDS